jgi:hypothetical protein
MFPIFPRQGGCELGAPRGLDPGPKFLPEDCFRDLIDLLASHESSSWNILRRSLKMLDSLRQSFMAT